MPRLLLLLVIVTACARPDAPATSGGAPAKTACADPIAFELGSGVPRDYAKAAETWACACADDDGDPDACAHVGIARGTASGVDLDFDGAVEMLDRACERGGALGCAILDSLGRPPDRTLAEGALARAAERCDAGDLDACAAEASLALAMQLGAPADAGDAARRACVGGRPYGCAAVRLIIDTKRQIVLRGCADEHLDEPACLARLKAARSGDPDFALETRIDALDEARCQAGDLGACDDTPALERARCDAHDWSACARLVDDLAALEAACDHRVADGCRALAIEARDRDVPAEDDARRHLERACGLGDRRSCEDAADPQLGGGCAALNELDAQAIPTLKLLRGVDHAGARITYAIEGPTLVIVWAPFVSPRQAEIEAFASSVSLPVVVLATAADPAEVTQGQASTVILDPPATDQNLGPQTTALGITKVPELLIVDADGRTRARVVALAFTVNHRRCIDQTLR